jgi:hypothetical protein
VELRGTLFVGLQETYMNDDASGWLWLIINVGLVLILGAALLYGVNQYRHRNRRLDPLRDKKTRDLYRKEDR